MTVSVQVEYVESRVYSNNTIDASLRVLCDAAVLADALSIALLAHAQDATMLARA
jgi:hypothetical protein